VPQTSARQINIMSNTTSPNALPSYSKPPVNEVVCGMIFQIPENLRIPHIGLLWNKLRAEYPIIQHAVPIASSKGELLIDITTGLPIQRVWFISKTEDQLVQFQFDRFYFNWRRKQGEYPRYPFVIQHFENVLKIAEDFFTEFELGKLIPVEYELSYINQILQGEGWNTACDFSKIFSHFIWNPSSDHFLSDPESMAWKVKFPIKDDMGSMLVSLRQTTRADDKKPVLVMELKAKGISKSAENNDMRKWFDVAHEWIVRGFTDLTTHEAHKIWGREV